MNSLRKYFRVHHWHRKVLILLAVAIAALGTGVYLTPLYRDWQTIRRLGSDDPALRDRAKHRAAFMAVRRPDFYERLTEAMDTESDLRFTQIVEVLKRIGRFQYPDIDHLWLDRERYLTLLKNRTMPASAPALKDYRSNYRSHIVLEMVIHDRDNRYVHKTAQAAVEDPDPGVRQTGGILAGATKQLQLLEKQLLDDDPGVAAMAAVDIALCGEGSSIEPILALLTGSLIKHDVILRQPVNTPNREKTIRSLREAISSAALALLVLDGKSHISRICRITETTKDLILRDRLIFALLHTGDDRAAKTVLNIVRKNDGPCEKPQAMAVEAATEMNLKEVIPVAKEILTTAASGKKPLTMQQVAAAMNAAMKFDIPCRRQVYEICRLQWGPDRPILVTRAARLLGRQVTIEKGQDSGSPGEAECLDLLLRAANYSKLVDKEKNWYRQTPLGSAAAAVALWELSPAVRIPEFKEDAPPVVWKNPVLIMQQVIETGGYLSADYIAWAVGTGGRPEAVDLGNAFFPEIKEEREKKEKKKKYRVFSPEVRITGAMILALSASTSEARAAVNRRLAKAWQREGYMDGRALLCAKMLVGDTQHSDKIQMLVWQKDSYGDHVFPLRRSFLALLAAGHRQLLDDILMNVNYPLDKLRANMTFLDMNAVFAAFVPELPRPNVCSEQETQDWVIRILRHVYSLKRKSIRIGIEHNQWETKGKMLPWGSSVGTSGTD